MKKNDTIKITQLKVNETLNAQIKVTFPKSSGGITQNVTNKRNIICHILNTRIRQYRDPAG